MQYFVRFLSPGSAETDNGWGGKLNSHLITSCIRYIHTKTYYNWITFLQVMMNKILVCFYVPQCMNIRHWWWHLTELPQRWERYR